MRNKIIALLLNIFLGALGIHKFYLGHYAAGVLYIIFIWTGIPFLLSIFDFVGLLLLSENEFDRRYNGRSGDLQRRLQQRILMICQQYRGATLGDCVMETGADVEEV